ncbi:MAG: CBS domain-containing protein [Pseudomonadota bacterium]
MLDKPIIPTIVEPRIVPKFASHASVGEAVSFMAEKNIGCVAIVDDGRLVGLFTERDVLRRVASKKLDLDATPIGNVMTPDPDTLSGEDRAGDALTLMTSKRYRHLPIVTDGEIQAILSIRDLQMASIEALSDALDGFAALELAD